MIIEPFMKDVRFSNTTLPQYLQTQELITVHTKFVQSPHKGYKNNYLSQVATVFLGTKTWLPA